LTALTSLAITLFLLVAGMEVDLSTVWRQGKAALSIGTMGIIVPFGLGMAAIYAAPNLMGATPDTDLWLFALFVATALSISALPVIAKTLLDLNLFRTDMGMVIVAANPAYMEATGKAYGDLIGRGLFDVFPESDPDARGERNVRASLSRVLETGKPHTMALQRYDVPVEGDADAFEERWWALINSPIAGPDNQVEWILIRAEDVTAYLRLIAGALEPSGRAVVTFFLLDEEWRRLEADGATQFRLPFERTPFCRYASEDDPLHRVGYEVEWVADAAREAAGHAGDGDSRGAVQGRHRRRRGSLGGDHRAEGAGTGQEPYRLFGQERPLHADLRLRDEPGVL
jgi:hypothetical protein